MNRNESLEGKLKKYAALEGWQAETVPDISKYLQVVRYHYNNLEIVDQDTVTEKGQRDLTTQLN